MKKEKPFIHWIGKPDKYPNTRIIDYCVLKAKQVVICQAFDENRTRLVFFTHKEVRQLIKVLEKLK